MVAVTAWVVECTSMVWPSGSAFATMPTPSVPPAPPRFSTITGWPIWVDTCSITARATMSTALPAVNGTITRTGLVGQLCAAAGPSACQQDARPR